MIRGFPSTVHGESSLLWGGVEHVLSSLASVRSGQIESPIHCSLRGEEGAKYGLWRGRLPCLRRGPSLVFTCYQARTWPASGFYFFAHCGSARSTFCASVGLRALCVLGACNITAQLTAVRSLVTCLTSIQLVSRLRDELQRPKSKVQVPFVVSQHVRGRVYIHYTVYVLHRYSKE